MERENFLGAVYIILKNDEGEILLQRRQGSNLWPGFMALPAGHIDEGENAFDAVIREAKEELAISVRKEDIIDIFVVNRRNKSMFPYFDVYFEFSSYNGEIRINEPDKCSELRWCDVKNLPNDMVEFQAQALKNRQENIFFSVIDTENCK